MLWVLESIVELKCKQHPYLCTTQLVLLSQRQFHKLMQLFHKTGYSCLNSKLFTAGICQFPLKYLPIQCHSAVLELFCHRYDINLNLRNPIQSRPYEMLNSSDSPKGRYQREGKGRDMLRPFAPANQGLGQVKSRLFTTTTFFLWWCGISMNLGSFQAGYWEGLFNLFTIFGHGLFKYAWILGLDR